MPAISKPVDRVDQRRVEDLPGKPEAREPDSQGAHASATGRPSAAERMRPSITRACPIASARPSRGSRSPRIAAAMSSSSSRYGFRRSTSIALERAVGAAQLDQRLDAVPGVVEEQRALGADRLELVARRQVEAAVERGQHVAREAQHGGEAAVHAARGEHVLARDPLGLAGQQSRAADAVAAHVHQRPAVELGVPAHVRLPREQERERRADEPQLADRSLVARARRDGPPAGGGAT